MKVIYLATYIHDHGPETSAERDPRKVWEGETAESFRESKEREIAERIEQLNPGKIFLEGSPQGRNDAYLIIFEAERLPGTRSNWTPLDRTLLKLAKNGVSIEGMENIRIFRLHRFVLDTEMKLYDWLLSGVCNALTACAQDLSFTAVCKLLALRIMATISKSATLYTDIQATCWSVEVAQRLLHGQVYFSFSV